MVAPYARHGTKLLQSRLLVHFAYGEVLSPALDTYYRDGWLVAEAPKHSRAYHTYDEIFEKETRFNSQLQLYLNDRAKFYSTSVKLFMSDYMYSFKRQLPTNTIVISLRRRDIISVFVSFLIAKHHGEFDQKLTEVREQAAHEGFYLEFRAAHAIGVNLIDTLFRDHQVISTTYEELLTADSLASYRLVPATSTNQESGLHVSSITNFSDVVSWFERDRTLWEECGFEVRTVNSFYEAIATQRRHG